MTYCCSVKINEGMVFGCDSRTNAGIDNISSFEKMAQFCNEGERFIGIVWSGHLGITQAVMHEIENSIKKQEENNILIVESMWDVANLISLHLRQIRHNLNYLNHSGIDTSANFLVGGQIRGEKMRLFMIYSEGNFIEVGGQVPFFQIGETKYGKPILDSVIELDMPLRKACTCVLVSFDSTMRSNLSVGLPIKLFAYEADTFIKPPIYHYDENSQYFDNISKDWRVGVKKVFDDLPAPF